jgi:hypothetical protein
MKNGFNKRVKNSECQNMQVWHSQHENICVGEKLAQFAFTEFFSAIKVEL